MDRAQQLENQTMDIMDEEIVNEGPDAPLQELKPVMWQTIFVWIARERNFAPREDAKGLRLRGQCGSLLRSLRRFRNEKYCRMETQSGVHLSKFLEWVFPGANAEAIAAMLSMICKYELEKIRQPTPPLLKMPDRRELESLFNRLTKGRDLCEADDIAGTRGLTLQKANLHSIIDVETVKRVFQAELRNGGEGLTLDKFLEFMCNDGYRAHERSTVARKNHAEVIRIHKEASGFSGWVFAEPPHEEMPLRKLTQILEEEIAHWRDKARRDKEMKYLGKFRRQGDLVGRRGALVIGTVESVSN